MKIGILGFGGMGQLHLMNCRLMDHLDIAVADTSKFALRKAQEMGAKETYTDYKELLERANVDAAIVTLPNFLHQESACLAAEKGVHIFVEKPLARNAKECQIIVQLAKKNSVKLMVGFYQRFVDRNQIVKSTINDGALGNPEFLVCELLGSGPFYHRYPPKPVPEWWFDIDKVGGGVLLDTGSHAIDLMRWLLDDDPSVEYVFLDYKYRLPLEDTAVLFLRFRTETKALLTAGWFTTKATQRIAVHGTAGSVVLGERDSEISSNQIIGEVVKNIVRKILRKKIQPHSLSAISRAYYKELEHFIHCVQEDEEPLVSGKDGLECAKIIDNAYQLWFSKNQLNK